MIDPFGTLLLELRDDGAVRALVDGRVRAEEPGPGDAGGHGDYQPFVVLSALASQRMRRVPVATSRYAVKCYGTTPQNAWEVYGACSDAIHDLGPRLRSNGVGIYISWDDTGGTADRDPVTHQPLVEAVIELIAATQAVAV